MENGMSSSVWSTHSPKATVWCASLMKWEFSCVPAQLRIVFLQIGCQREWLWSPFLLFHFFSPKHCLWDLIRLNEPHLSNAEVFAGLFSSPDSLTQNESMIVISNKIANIRSFLCCASVSLMSLISLNVYNVALLRRIIRVEAAWNTIGK